MVLIPRESAEHLLNVRKSVQTPGSKLSRLDIEMSEILNSTQFDNDREKWDRYHQVLQRYLNTKEVDERTDKSKLKSWRKRGPMEPMEYDTKKIDAAEKKIKKKSESHNDEFIIENIPESFKKNARLLVKALRKDGRIVWGPTGTLHIDGKAMKGSNIIDLVNYASRNRKVDAPPGLTQFTGALHAASIPAEYIGNVKYRREVGNFASLKSSTPNPTSHTSGGGDTAYFESTGGNREEEEGEELTDGEEEEGEEEEDNKIKETPTKAPGNRTVATWLSSWRRLPS